MAHPEVDAALPEDAYIFFEVEGESHFNEYGRQLAQRRQRDDGVAPVRVKGLAPPQQSRLIDPEIAAHVV